MQKYAEEKNIWTVFCKLGRAVFKQNKAASSELFSRLFTGTLSKLYLFRSIFCIHWGIHGNKNLRECLLSEREICLFCCTTRACLNF